MLRAAPIVTRRMFRSSTNRDVATSSSGPHDPFFSSVVLLVENDNAANGSNTFVDQSNSAHVMTAAGTIAYSNAQAPTGMTTSGKSGGASDAISTPNSADFVFGTGDFTVEAMIFVTSNPSFGVIVQDAVAVSWATGWTMYVDTSAGMKHAFYINGSNVILGGITMALNTWHHVAVTRAGTSLQNWVDGVLDRTATNSANIAPTQPLRMFSDASGADNMVGFQDCVRITKGVARYSANFTPPTLPLPTS